MNEPIALNILHELKLGTELSEGDQRKLAGRGRVVEMKEGQTICREGDKHPIIYWLLDGCVILEMSTGGTSPKLLLTLGCGDLLAWSAMLSGGRMTATATTCEPTRLLACNAHELNELCRSNHDIGFHVMEHLARQLSKRLLATRLQLLDLFQQPSECDR